MCEVMRLAEVSYLMCCVEADVQHSRPLLGQRRVQRKQPRVFWMEWSTPQAEMSLRWLPGRSEKRDKVTQPWKDRRSQPPRWGLLLVTPPLNREQGAGWGEMQKWSKE